MGGGNEAFGFLRFQRFHSHIEEKKKEIWWLLDLTMQGGRGTQYEGGGGQILSTLHN